MAISMSSFASTVSRMVAENAIESDETNRTIRKSAHAQALGQIAVETAQKEQANNLNSAMSYVNMASSAVNVAKSGQGIVQAADTAQQQQTTQPQLEQGLQAAHEGEGVTELSDVRLGEGPRVGDRFNDEQLGVLTREGPVTESSEELQRMGFSEREAEDLIRVGQDGLSTDEAVSFMWDHRQTQQQQNEQHTRDKLLEALQSQPVAMFSQAMSQESKNARKEASRSSELSNMLDGVEASAAEATLKHNQKLGEIDVAFVKQREGVNKQSSKKG